MLKRFEGRLRWRDSITNPNIIQLKGNVIPKGLIPLERLFDANYVLVNVSKKSWENDVEDCNLETKRQLKLVKMKWGISKDYK